MIPVASACWRDGRDCRCSSKASASCADQRVLVLTQASETLHLRRTVDAEPVPSLLRGFSAPVILDYDYSDAELLALLAHDTDPFNRWEAGQRLALRRAARGRHRAAARPVQLDAPFVEAMRSVLRHPALDAAFKELVLTLPARDLHRRAARRASIRSASTPCAKRCARSSRRRCAPTGSGPTKRTRTTARYAPDPVSAGRRALADLALAHAVPRRASPAATPCGPASAYQRFKDASQHDRPLQRAGGAGRSRGHELAAPGAASASTRMFEDEPLVIDKWFALQAGAPDRGGNVLPRRASS